MMMRNMTATEGSTTERRTEVPFVLTRVLYAPRHLVFKTWTEPDHVRRWWGPRAFTTPFCKIDLRPGGLFHYCMRSAEGKDYWGRGLYREVIRPERLVYEDSFSNEDGGIVAPKQYGMSPDWPERTLTTIMFEDQDGQTRLTITGGVSEALAKSQKADIGWNESLDRLAAYLAEIAPRK